MEFFFEWKLFGAGDIELYLYPEFIFEMLRSWQLGISKMVKYCKLAYIPSETMAEAANMR